MAEALGSSVGSLLLVYEVCSLLLYPYDLTDSQSSTALPRALGCQPTNFGQRHSESNNGIHSEFAN